MGKKSQFTKEDNKDKEREDSYNSDMPHSFIECEVDGIERLASVYEAEGNIKKAVEFYRKTVQFMKTTSSVNGLNPGYGHEISLIYYRLS